MELALGGWETGAAAAGRPSPLSTLGELEKRLVTVLDIIPPSDVTSA